MREEHTILMSCPSFPHHGCPTSSDLSDFPSFPVIHYTSISSNESSSNDTKSDTSSLSPLKSSSMAPQDCSSTPDLSSPSLSSQNLPSQTEHFPSASCQDSTLRTQGACPPISLENCPSIHDYTYSYSSVSETEYSPSSLVNSASTVLTFSHSLSLVNNSSTSQPESSSSPKSPVNCSCQPEYSSTSCQNSTSISETTNSSLSPQDCKSKSEHTQSHCPSMPQINGPSTSRTDDHSISPLDSSSAYVIPTGEDLSDFSSESISGSSILSVHGRSSTSTLNCQPVNQHAQTTKEWQVKSLSEECSLGSSISSIDIPCICTYDLPNDFTPGISSSYPNEHGSPFTSQSLNCDLSDNITPSNGTTPPQINATAHPSDLFTSTDHNYANFDCPTPCSTQSFQPPKFPEIDVVSTNDELSVDHILVNGHYDSQLSTKSTCRCSLLNSADSSPFISNTLPTSDITCPNSTDHSVFTSTHEKHPKMLSSCPHCTHSATTPKYLLFPEDENQVQECEVCKASLENKVRMDQDRQLCEHFLDSLYRFEDWLQIAQITTSQGSPYKTLHQEAKLALRKYEVLLTEMREKLLELESLNRQYWRLTQTTQQTLLPSVLRSRMQEVNALWDGLQGEAETLHRTFKSRVQQREEFETDQDDMKLCLTEMDLELSNVEYIYGGNSTEKIQQLKAFQEDVWSNMKKVEGLLERGDQLMDNSDPRDAADLEVEMTELGSYCQQIYIRLSRLQKRLVSTKLVFEDDFLDSTIEHLSSGSSDVFLDLDIEEEETSSPVKIPFTSAALPVDLEWDPLGDVGRSSSHDGQESFYTATSAPWKLLQRSEGSQSSLSSFSGIAHSNMRRQEGKETLENIHSNHTPPLDTGYLEWTQEQIHGPEDTENSSELHNSLIMLETKGPDIVSCSVALPLDEPDSENRMANIFALPGNGKAADPERPCHEDDCQSQITCSGQRRRQRKKKRMGRNQDVKQTLKPTKPDVSILMENGDDMPKTSYRPSCSLCLWIKCLALASVLLLVLFTSIPWGHQTCPSKRFSWSLMLTYVNGPPPT